MVSLVVKKNIKKDVYVYENDLGNRIVYLGMVHLGEEAYYESVKAVVDSLRELDYLILYEGVNYDDYSDTLKRKFRKVTGIYLSNLHDLDNKSIGMPKNALKYIQQTANNTGLNRNRDIVADERLDSLIYRYEKEYLHINLSPCDWETSLNAKYKCKDTVSHSKLFMIKTLRERKVVEVIEKHPNRNFVVLYGRSHRFTLTGSFKKAGYKLIEGKLRAF